MKTTLLMLAAMAAPAQAGLISLNISGAFGPLMAGDDPLKLAGQGFVVYGTFSAGLLPIAAAGDSATYALPDTLQIVVAGLTLTAYDAVLTISDPVSGPDAVHLSFSVIPLSFSPDVYTILELPEGTLDGTGIQDFSSGFSAPASSLTYQAFGTSTVLSGELGIAGSVSLAGARGAETPEPDPVSLLGIGLAGIGCVARKRRYQSVAL
ncbi:MAG: hypothetical protein ABSH50_02490 [Bryobacteraceae bacterium]|jgi:hypothetical protein